MVLLHESASTRSGGIERQPNDLYYRAYPVEGSFNSEVWHDLVIVLEDLGYKILDAGYGSDFAGLQLDTELTVEDKILIANDYGFKILNSSRSDASLGYA